MGVLLVVVGIRTGLIFSPIEMFLTIGLFNLFDLCLLTMDCIFFGGDFFEKFFYELYGVIYFKFVLLNLLLLLFDMLCIWLRVRLGTLRDLSLIMPCGRLWISSQDSLVSNSDVLNEEVTLLFLPLYLLTLIFYGTIWSGLLSILNSESFPNMSFIMARS